MFVFGKVTTNLDVYENETWPSVFVKVPKIGSYVESLRYVSLKVIRITHCVIPAPGKLDKDEPYIKIEVGN